MKRKRSIRWYAADNALQNVTPTVAGMRWRIERKVGEYHVGMSPLAVALAVARCLRGFRAFPKHVKRAVVRTAMREHMRNRQTYVAIMSGRLERLPR